MVAHVLTPIADDPVSRVDELLPGSCLRQIKPAEQHVASQRRDPIID